MRKSMHWVLLCIQIDSKSMRKGGSCRYSLGSCLSVLTQNLGLQDVSAKHSSQLLTVEQKENWLNLHRLFTTRWSGSEFQEINYYRWSRCESTGTMSKWSSSLHSGRQNHPQDWKKWQLLRCEENSHFLWLLWFLALQVCSWRLNSESGIYLTVLQHTGEAVQKLMTGTWQ